MEWWILLITFLGCLVLLMMTGLPVAFCFLIINVVGVYIYWGGQTGLEQLIIAMSGSVSTFTLLPLPLFVFMGEVLFRSGIAIRVMDTIGAWMGRVPGKLGLLAVAGGSLMATLTGSSMGSTAMLGSMLVPEMERRGYKKPMSLGPILGSAGLAVMIPPSNFGIVLAALADLSVAKILIAGAVPGLMMAVLYAVYILGRCWLQPDLAPPYETETMPIRQRLIATVKYVLPLGSVIFAVLGLIFVGLATPSESAAMGLIVAVILAICYKGMNWDTLKKSLFGTLRIVGMTFLIITGSRAFSQILAFSGATVGVVQFVTSLTLPPVLLVILMQLGLTFLGMFMGAITIIIITVPIFYPIVHALGINPLWFGLLMLLNMEMCSTTPPFGMTLFVMKGSAPPDTTMGDIYKAALPFLFCDIIVMAIMLIFPAAVLYLPNVMKG